MPCDLGSALDLAVKSHDHLLHGKDVRVVREDEHPGEVTAPESMVRIAVGNLVRHAFQYTMSGTLRLELRKDATVRISGSRPNFEFLGSENNAGMGLTIVTRVCERMGWRLGLTHHPDEGTRVELSFQ